MNRTSSKTSITLRRLPAPLAVVTLASLVSVCVMISNPQPAAPPPVTPLTTCALTTTQMSITLEQAEMVPICDDVYSEPGLTPAENLELQGDYETARRNLVRAFDQETRSSPVTLFCHSPACKVAFGADPTSATAKDLGFARDALPTKDGILQRSAVIVTGPVSGSARILTHELVHAEMKMWAAYESLPTWFNEGMATFVASEPNCDSHPPSSVLDVEILNTKAAWQRHLRDHHGTLEVYCQSRHHVATWAARFGNEKRRAAALKRLMTSVAGGMPFERAFRGAP